jgi:hypothetical protein
LRYSLEFAAGIYGGKTERFTRKLAGLQDGLGLMQDAEVATKRLLELATSNEHSLPAVTVFAMGGVAERYRSEAQELLHAMPKRLQVVTGKSWDDLAEHMERVRRRLTPVDPPRPVPQPAPRPVTEEVPGTEARAAGTPVDESTEPAAPDGSGSGTGSGTGRLDESPLETGELGGVPFADDGVVALPELPAAGEDPEPMVVEDGADGAGETAGGEAAAAAPEPESGGAPAGVPAAGGDTAG